MGQQFRVGRDGCVVKSSNLCQQNTINVGLWATGVLQSVNVDMLRMNHKLLIYVDQHESVSVKGMPFWLHQFKVYSVYWMRLAMYIYLHLLTYVHLQTRQETEIVPETNWFSSVLLLVK